MAKPSRQGAYVITTRSGIVENRHEIHVSVVDAQGTTLLQLGREPARLTLVRSAAKPWQALAVAETGALERFGFDDADLALMCASHSGEERHVERAKAMLKRGGHVEADLRCGGHAAILRARDEEWLRNGIVPTPVWSNCSGKHSGVLAGAKAIGAGAEGYHELAHPIQQRIKKITEELSGLRPDEVKWAVDGCNMASPAMPLTDLAHVYALFAQASDDVSSGAEATPRERHMARIFNAMSTYPDMVAGEDRFCTALMGAFGGRLFGKVGADGCYGVGLRECEATRRLGAKGALGISIKVEDGSLDALYAATSELLRQLDIGTEEERSALESFRAKKLVNTAGVVTGGYEFPFDVRAA
ncbi:thermolabile L-asparaginase [Purpureocillium lavendulum]|uniref:Thermolabile L-asparaginase n=1 Tax=Purpureocillium lavendulum TaxID=1247861 RepID=A0AB34G7C5_9HYPO|nr:thermolabile L-asparaginase [Purpureocillium lavendulum]